VDNNNNIIIEWNNNWPINADIDSNVINNSTVDGMRDQK
jgi:hypothetical protein